MTISETIITVYKQHFVLISSAKTRAVTAAAKPVRFELVVDNTIVEQVMEVGCLLDNDNKLWFNKKINKLADYKSKQGVSIYIWNNKHL